jgi:hypothetical protein
MSSNDNNDLFACFGDEDDSDASVEATDAADSREVALQLMQKFNSNMKRESKKETSQSASDGTTFEYSYQDQKLRTADLPWPHHPPLYLGPIHLDKSLAEGGGRGYVASRDLPHGTCVLIEEPVVDGWSDEQMGK